MDGEIFLRRYFFFFIETIYIPKCEPEAKTGRRLLTVCGIVRRRTLVRFSGKYIRGTAAPRNTTV